jgi:hypothetical protein
MSSSKKNIFIFIYLEYKDNQNIIKNKKGDNFIYPLDQIKTDLTQRGICYNITIGAYTQVNYSFRTQQLYVGL